MKVFKKKNLAFYNEDCVTLLSSTKLKPESIDFIITDPPYACSKSFITRNKAKPLNSDFGLWDVFTTHWLSPCYNVLKKNSGMVVFVPATRFETLVRHAEAVGFKYVQPWYWWKSNPPVAIRGTLQWAVEQMIYLRKGKHVLRVSNNGKAPNIFKYPIVQHDRIHNTQKPIMLLSEIVELVSKEGDTIFDPFAGSCSTGIAAHSLKRKFIGIEREKEHFERAVKKWTSQGKYFHDMFIG